jgi:FkbM family methyltransferase
MNGTLLVKEVRRALRPLLPQPILNWRETQYYSRYGEIELHLVETLCKRDQDSIDVGANDGSYVHFLRKHSRCVHAFEPIPAMAYGLTRRFPRRVIVHEIALSRSPGSAILRTPVVDDVVVAGCSTISQEAAAQYPTHQEIEVRTDTLDNVYHGDVGFIKIDVEGHEEAVLDGARETIARCRPRMLIEIVERLSPGALGRITEFCQGFNYRGYFIFQRSLLPIDRFDVKALQNLENYPDLTATLDQRERFGRFIHNFLFLPDADPDGLLRDLEARIARL